MWRIDDPDAVASQPTIPAAGTQGFFTEGNPAGGVPATPVPQWWLNRVQEELRAVVVAGGLSPSKSVQTQLRDALPALYGGGGVLGSANGASGWQRLPGGLIMQWGTGTTPQAAGAQQNAAVDITLPLAFPAYVLGGPLVTLNDGGITGSSWAGTTLFAAASLTTLTVSGVARDYAPTGGFGFNWLALGR